VELFQAEWCPYSHRVRQRLTELGLDFTARQVAADPDELISRIFVMGRAGFEPAALGLKVPCSAD
jgi:glutaredoxin